MGVGGRMIGVRWLALLDVALGDENLWGRWTQLCLSNGQIRLVAEDRFGNKLWRQQPVALGMPQKTEGFQRKSLGSD